MNPDEPDDRIYDYDSCAHGGGPADDSDEARGILVRHVRRARDASKEGK